MLKCSFGILKELIKQYRKKREVSQETNPILGLSHVGIPAGLSLWKAILPLSVLNSEKTCQARTHCRKLKPSYLRRENNVKKSRGRNPSTVFIRGFLKAVIFKIKDCILL